MAQIFPVSTNRVDRVALLLESRLSHDAELTLGLRHAPHVWDFRGEEDLATARATISAGATTWVEFDLDACVEPEKLYYVHVSAQPGLFWKMAHENEDDLINRGPVGVTPANLPGSRFWRPFRDGRSGCMRITPSQSPFAAGNVVRGTNRPDRWTNLWMSDPRRELPAWLRLDWRRPMRFNTVQLTFDTNMNRRVRLPLFRYPECVKDYRIEYRRAGMWHTLIEVEDNYFRRRVHRFDPVRADALRVRILATNGVANARVYEVRVYNEEA